ncbi:lipopolysaccharide assembly protein LapB [Desulfopila sp. IMCC35008]|uniref:tetratricopeptide repeat protein n=1 Tax=Desulfopila sp. IMCC35008 TaxID=2653858 RepID=UPI0013D025A3|nr:tetratricopeptide repeat protein [Desulfopila sp. IMCC35008]
MKRLFYIFFCIFLFQTANAIGATKLLRMNKLDSNDLTQIFFTCDTLPEYHHQVFGKRINLFFSNTTIDNAFSLLEGGDTIVKNLIDTRDNTTILSFFLRYPPQKVDISTTGEDKLVLEILAGNEYSRVYRDFTQKFGGLSVVQDDRMDYTNPLASSPYIHDWSSFFSRYLAPVDIPVPVTYTLPEFPIYASFPSNDTEKHLFSTFPAEIIEAGRSEMWDEVLSSTLIAIGSEFNQDKKKILAFTYGESLLRKGDWKSAYKQFYLLADNYPAELIGFWAKYLLLYITAVYDDPFLAAYEADEFAKRVPAVSNLSAYLHLLRIETALATKEMEKMLQLLESPYVAIPDKIFDTVELRRADQLWASAKRVPAYAAYKSTDNLLLEKHSYSLNGYCDSLFRFKNFAGAAECYQQLNILVEEKNTRALVAYMGALSKLQTADKDKNLTELFIEIEDTYPGTEGAYRAALKKNDHRYLLDPKWLSQGIKYYHALGENSSWKDVNEEAFLKEAISYHLLNETENAIPILMKLIRDFRTGKLKTHSEALLITLLPGEIRRLIEEKQYLKALALAKQNKYYFERNWIKTDLFPELADAYLQANLNKEAEKSYLYLYDISPKNKKEDYFLPLIRSIFDQGKYYMVDDYATQYDYLYPEGKYKADILDLRLQALILLDKYDKAMALLPDPLPEDVKTRQFAASVYFYNNEFEKSRDILSAIDHRQLSTDDIFILAESFLRTEDYPGATPLFEELIEKDYRPEQCMYRLAEIANKNGDREKSLKYYEKIVEKGNDSLWTKYAERELRFIRLSESIQKGLDG